MKIVLNAFVLLLIGLNVYQTNAQIQLIGYTPSKCNESIPAYLVQNRVISKTISNDTFNLHIGFSENCCIEFDPLAHYKNDTLFIAPYKKPPSILCDCNCCYELVLHFSGITDTSLHVSYRNEVLPVTQHPYPTQPISFEIFEGDTVNMRNIYGFKEGEWILFYDSTNLVKTRAYHDGKASNVKERPYKVATYSKEGLLEQVLHKDTIFTYDKGQLKMKEMWIKENKDNYYAFYRIQETYYPNGKLKSRCQPKDKTKGDLLSTPLDDCIYWNENGELIK